MEAARMRALRVKVEDHGEVLDRIVDQIVTKYNKDLNEFLLEVKEKLEQKDDLTDEELENLVLKIPVFMYFASSGLETLGIESDSAKAVKLDIYNENYLRAAGTIKDKEASAALNTTNESLIEIAFVRAYKKLKVQIDMAEHVFSGAKKVLSKRMQIIDIEKRDT